MISEVEARARLTCSAWLPESLGHFWFVGVDVTIEIPEFFERHQEAPGGWVWVVCRDCEKGYMVPEDMAPARGRAVVPAVAPAPVEAA